MNASIEKRLDIDSDLKRKLASGIRKFFRDSGKSNAVVGLSGGVDSAVVCGLLAGALGPRRVFAYYLPYFPVKEDERHALLVSRKFGVRLESVGIRPSVDALAAAAGAADKSAVGNIMARTRMALLYHFARENHALVVGTGNRTELLLGYFTKYGDGASDVLPLGMLYKTQVWRLAGAMGIPGEIVARPPSAGLWPGQTDEYELGLKYPDADSILVALADLKWGRKKAIGEFGAAKVSAVENRMHAGRHKRLPPEILRV
ncbi:MAG: NAD+ synthase [Candidatus Micrarchaeota archaeon]